MERIDILKQIPHIAPQGAEAKRIRKKCVTGSQASSLLSYPYDEPDREAWRTYTDSFGVEPKPQAHGYIGYRCHQDLWRTRQGLDAFKGNEATEWGNKMEGVALMLYELVFDTKVHEFGIIPDAKLDWLYISPDAIAENGKMVEIKCPLWRRIRDDGWMSREYWAQTQLQLRVCNSYTSDPSDGAKQLPPFSLHFAQNKLFIYMDADHYRRDQGRSRNTMLAALARCQKGLRQNENRRVHLIQLPIKGAVVQISRIHTLVPPKHLIGCDEEMILWASRTARAVKTILRFVHRCLRKTELTSDDLALVKPLYWYHTRMTVTHVQEDRKWFAHVQHEMRLNNETAQLPDFYPNAEMPASPIN